MYERMAGSARNVNKDRSIQGVMILNGTGDKAIRIGHRISSQFQGLSRTAEDALEYEGADRSRIGGPWRRSRVPDDCGDRRCTAPAAVLADRRLLRYPGSVTVGGAE
jgi:hypothetical protein